MSIQRRTVLTGHCPSVQATRPCSSHVNGVSKVAEASPLFKLHEVWLRGNPPAVALARAPFQNGSRWKSVRVTMKGVV